MKKIIRILYLLVFAVTLVGCSIDRTTKITTDQSNVTSNNTSTTVDNSTNATTIKPNISNSTAINNEDTIKVTYMVDGEVYLVNEEKKLTNIHKPENPTKIGYDFDCWLTEDGEQWSFLGYVVAQDLTLYAKWNTHSYNISYDLDGGTNNSNNPTSYTILDNIELINPTKTGYTFSHWSLNNENISSITPGMYGNIELKANWSINSYKVSIVYDNLKGDASGDGSYEYNSKVSLIATTKPGYTFSGWYSNSSFTNLLSNSDNYSFVIGDNNKTIYAKFIENTYKVNYYDGDTIVFTDQAKYKSNYVIKEYAIGEETVISWKIDNQEIEANSSIEYSYTSNINLYSVDKVYSGNDYTIEYESNEAKITKYNGSSTIVVIPEKIYSNNKIYSVTSIESGAFSGCSSLTSITIPDSVTSIGSSAFYRCSSLTSITIPDSVTSIGRYAFDCCSSLESITLPFVGDKAHTSTDTYQYPFGYIFGTSSYTGGTVTTQYYYGSSTSKTTNTSYYIPSTLKSVTITGSTYIPYGAFYNCSSLTSITIGDSVASIGDYTFYNCSSLTSITIGDGVTSIGNRAFSGCSSLTSITIPDSVTSIGWDAFYNCSSLTSITIPDSVTSIGYSAFYGCSSLTSITIGDSVTSIGELTFYRCSSLTSITIGDSVTSIGNNAFYRCSSLTSIIIPDSVTSIGDYAFQNCSSLTSITIPDSVTLIEKYAFSGCNVLSKVYYLGASPYTNTITSIGSNNTCLTNATWYYFTSNGASETVSGNWWYYDTDGVTIIEKVVE